MSFYAADKQRSKLYFREYRLTLTGILQLMEPKLAIKFLLFWATHKSWKYFSRKRTRESLFIDPNVNSWRHHLAEVSVASTSQIFHNEAFSQESRINISSRLGHHSPLMFFFCFPGTLADISDFEDLNQNRRTSKKGFSQMTLSFV